MRTSRYIVRGTTGMKNYQVGSVCMSFTSTDSISARSNLQVRVWFQNAPWKVAWLPRRLLLAERLAFHNCPKVNFWFLMQKTSVYCHENCPLFVTDVSDNTGNVRAGAPWRFESEGEAMYFLRTRKISRKGFIVCYGGK